MDERWAQMSDVSAGKNVSTTVVATLERHLVTSFSYDQSFPMEVKIDLTNLSQSSYFVHWILRLWILFISIVYLLYYNLIV